MKTECIQEKLQSALIKTVRMTGKGASFPILSCILVEAKGTMVVIRATNLDLGIEISLPAKVEKEGKIAVPGAVFAQYIASLPAGKRIQLECKDNNLVITTDRGKTTIKGIAHDDFPVIPKIGGDTSFMVPIDQFVRGLRSVWYSASVSTIKPELSSVYIAATDGVLCFVATDAFRLAEKKIPVKNIPDHKPILIPMKNISDIFRTFEDMNGEAEIMFNENQISIYFETIYVTSRLTDGMFPDYQQIVPKTAAIKAIVLKNDLLNALKVATIFSNKLNQSKITISPKNKNIEIVTKNAETGENTEFIEASISGEGIEMMVNFRYLLDCFQSISADSISLACIDARKPVIVTGVGDSSFLYLVMPMNNT